MDDNPFDDIDFDLPPRKPKPGFPVHEIRVTAIAYEEPAGAVGIDPTICEYEIDHGRCEFRGDECIVESHVNEMGLHQSLFGTFDRGEGDNRIQTQVYRVRGWVAHYPSTPNGPEEWDAGIEPVDD